MFVEQECLEMELWWCSISGCRGDDPGSLYVKMTSLMATMLVDNIYKHEGIETSILYSRS